MPATANPEYATVTTRGTLRRFEFERDSFAFANELHWEYRFDAGNKTTTSSKRDPKPDYAHRCFVLVRAARLFHYHARFDEHLVADANEPVWRRRIQEVMRRNPRVPCQPGDAVVFPGFAHLREFSGAHEALLKAECGGAWHSYVQRSHWRMIFPISRTHQARTAEHLLSEIRRGASPIIHLVLFPKLTINHAILLFDATQTPRGVVFQAYDPNDPAKPSKITFDATTKIFSFPANRYWIGGELDVIEIYRGWWM